MLWQVVWTILQYRCGKDSGPLHVKSASPGEHVSYSSSWCCAWSVFHLNNWRVQSGQVLLWLSGFGKPNQWQSEDKKIRGRSAVGDCGNILKVENLLPEEMTYKNCIKNKVCIVPTTFWPLQYINDTRYCPRDSTLETERFNNLRNKNVQFLQVTSPSLHEDFKSLRTFTVQALHKTALSNELLVHY